MTEKPTGAPVASSSTIDLRHATPASTIYAGPRALGALARELERAGSKSVLVVSTPSLDDTTTLQLTLDAVGSRLAGKFGDVRRYSPTDVVEALAARIVHTGADAIVVLGGGSAMVTARAAAVLAGEGRPLRQLLTQRDDTGKVVNPPLKAPKLPIWIVPSTPTPAMAKAGVALRDSESGRRVALFDPKVRAAGIAIDPAALSSSPSSLFVATALNGLSMGVEGLLATAEDPFAEALLFQGVREIVSNLRRVVGEGDGFDARARIAMGSILAGQGTDYSGAGLALALSHEIAPNSSVSGGVVEAILLPYTVGFTSEAVPDRLPIVAAALGSSDPGIDGVSAALKALVGDLGVPTRLGGIGIAPDRVASAVEHAVDDWAMNARMPRRAERSDLEDIVQLAW